MQITTTTAKLLPKLELRLTLTIVLGFIASNVYSLPIHAQTRTSNSTIFENIEAGEKGWNFISEEETISIQDNLDQLEDYSIMNLDSDSDLRLIEQDRRWRKQGERPNYPDYSLETDVYDY